MSTRTLPAARARRNLDREAEWVERFALVYRTRLGTLARAVNESAAGGPGPVAADALRHCIEAVDLVLDSHAEFARLLRGLAAADPAGATARVLPGAPNVDRTGVR